MSKLEEIKNEYEEITEKLKRPDEINDSQKFGELSKKRSELEPLMKKINQYLETKKRISENKELAQGEGELAELAATELEELKEKREKMKK